MSKHVYVQGFGERQRRYLIRGMASTHLCGILKLTQTLKGRHAFEQSGNGPETLVAIAEEALRRPDITGCARSWAMGIAPSPCSCGKPGLYIVGVRTYCRTCRPQAVARRQALVAFHDHQTEEFVQGRKDWSDARLGSRAERQRGYSFGGRRKYGTNLTKP